MKILYLPIIHPNSLRSTGVADYQTDTLFYGLRKLFGADVTDGNRMWHMYKGEKEKSPEIFSKLWGKGFSCYGLLEEYDIDRDDIETKLENRFYDYIILPIHHSENHNHGLINAFISTVLEYYNPSEVALVDGWDRSKIDTEIASKCLYFKRELIEKYRDIALPISFSIPKEKTVELGEQEFDFSPLIPAFTSPPEAAEHFKTYTYDNEEDYYEMYSKSRFSYTCKKGRYGEMNEGWDALRHYEILASGSIPFFTDIEQCPPLCLEKFPKDLCIKAKKIRGVYPGTKNRYNPSESGTYIGSSTEIDSSGHIDGGEFDPQEYDDLRYEFRTHFLKHNTCEQTAKHFIDRLRAA